MTRYYFHIRNGQALVRDEEGMECADIAAVRREAFLSARDIVRSTLKSEVMGNAAVIEVQDEQGRAIDYGMAASLENDR